MALLELSIFPMDKGTHVGEYVARAVDIIDKSGLPYELTGMGTLIEGEWEDVMGVAKRCCDALQKESDRVYCVMKYDWARGKTKQLRGKVERVERVLGRSLHTDCH